MWNTHLPARPLLICLAPSQGHQQSIWNECHILDIKADHLATTEAAGKPNQQQGPVPNPHQGIGQSIYYRQQVFPKKGCCLPLGPSMKPANPPQGRPDMLALGGVGTPLRHMGFAYRHRATLQRDWT
ncbi:hypothetical protein LRK55_10460 [Rhodanobacter denitrificans]|nr:hypothetical protein [Rhodanobacter denitrificans]UJJ57096.1 hypothetical protein LRK55_10460 [Rhodanobacter denitrificans]